MGDTVLVYRDRLVPRSEVAFLRRQYLGFRRLTPLWIGWRTDDGLAELGAEPLILGRSGVRGVLDRVLFKQFGRLPAQPDLRLSHARVIHAHFGRGGALALPIARALGIPLVVTFHGGDATKEKHYLPGLVPTIYQRRLAALQQEASVIVCVSNYIRDRLAERGFPTEKLHVVRYGIEIDETPPTAAMASPYVLFVGRFVEKKGIRFLIEAMRLLERRGKLVPLILIGDGSLAAELREEARALEQITFMGWRPNSEVRQWMHGAVAVCVPSVTAASGDTEGLPNVVIEAMAQGAPVIGSRHSGIAEAIEHERTGLLVPSGDATAIADAIGWLLDHPDAQRTMAKMARERARTHFDAIRQSRLLEDLLLSVWQGERGSSQHDGGPACLSR